VLLFVSGYLARFDLLADGADDWTPFNSLPAKHAKWIDKEPGFPEVARPFFFSCMGKEKTLSDETQSSVPLKHLTLLATWNDMMPFVNRPLTITI
jgi:hypothetical protein